MRRWIIACTLAAVCGAPGASAEPLTPASSSFQQGNELLRSHRYAEAVERYHASLQEEQSAKAWLNLSIALHQLNRNAEAAAALTRYLEAPDKNPEKLEFAQALLARVNAQLASIRVETRPAGAEVTIDGRRVGVTPLSSPIRLDPGTHAVRAQRSSRTAAETIDVVAGDSRQVVLRLNTHELDLSPERAPQAGAPLEPRPVPAERAEPLQGQRLWAVIAGGVGLASLGVGSFFGVKAANRWQEAQDKCPRDRCVDREDVGLADDVRRSARLATAGFVVSGAALTLGAGLWLTAPRAEPRGARPHLGAAVLPGSATLVVSGNLQ